MENSLKEQLSEYAHEAWAGWMKYVFGKSSHNDDGSITIPKWAVDRWTRQINTDYCDLPDEEKQSDRDEADLILKIIKNARGRYRVWLEKPSERYSRALVANPHK